MAQKYKTEHSLHNLKKKNYLLKLNFIKNDEKTFNLI